MSSVQNDRIEASGPGADPFFVKADPERAETVAPGIRRQLLGHGAAIMGARVWFSEGAVGDVHSHPHTQNTGYERLRRS